jgi:transposase
VPTSTRSVGIWRSRSRPISGGARSTRRCVPGGLERRSYGTWGYPAEFRRRALDLVAAGKTVAEVARLLEVSDQSIYTWRRQELIDRGELPGLSSEEREELRVARRRIRELERELAVHRRAAELLKEEVRPKGGSRRSR